MSNALKKYSHEVAKVCIYNAIELTRVLDACREDIYGYEFSESEKNEIATAFSFMNLMIAVGVWSNLSDERIRADLNSATKNDLIIGMSHFLNRGNASESAIAATFAKLQIDDLAPFGAFWKREFYSLVEKGQEPDSRLTLIVTMDWINRKEQFVREEAIKCFTPKAIDSIQKLETIANEMVKAQNE